jgi:predicted esterase
MARIQAVFTTAALRVACRSTGVANRSNTLVSGYSGGAAITLELGCWVPASPLSSWGAFFITLLNYTPSVAG